MNQSAPSGNGQKAVSLRAKRHAMKQDVLNLNQQKQAEECLRERIAATCNFEVKTPKDFDLLAAMIYQKTHCIVSVSTLKRFWGYITSRAHTSASTLNIFARYVGYADFEDFKSSIVDGENEVKTLSKQELSRQLNRIRMQATSLCEQILRLEERIGK